MKMQRFLSIFAFLFAFQFFFLDVRAVLTSCVGIQNVYTFPNVSSSETMSKMIPYGQSDLALLEVVLLVARVTEMKNVILEIFHGSTLGLAPTNSIVLEELTNIESPKLNVVLQTDGENNIFVGGTIQTSTSKRIFMAKYGPSSNLIWLQYYSNTDPALDASIIGVSLQSSGDLVIIGSTFGLFQGASNQTPVNNQTASGFLARISSQNGTIVWTYQEQDTSTNFPSQVKCDLGNGVCYVIWAYGAVATIRSFDDSNGVDLLSAPFSSSFRLGDGEILLFPSGDLGVSFITSSTDQDMISVKKLSSTFGSTDFVSPIEIAAIDPRNVVTSSVFDSNRNLYIFGSSIYQFSSANILSAELGFIIKITSNGQVYFTINVDAQNGFSKITSGYAVTENSLLVSGFFSGSLETANSSLSSEYFLEIGSEANLFGQSCTSNCQTTCPVAGTNSITCSSGIFGSGACLCPEGWTGATCNHQVSSPSSSSSGSSTDSSGSSTGQNNFPVWVQALVGCLAGLILITLVAGAIIIVRRRRVSTYVKKSRRATPLAARTSLDPLTKTSSMDP